MTTELPTPPAPHHVDKHSPSLISLPPEVTTKIYEYSASFSDVFALAATGRRLNHVWRTSVNHIYHSVAARSISCARDARRFLVEQRQYGSKPEESHPMDVGSVHQMVRNANIVEKAVLQFELEIVCRVRRDGISPEEFYGAGALKHPPTLTHTERIRFIRTYYSLWGLMKLNPADWTPRLESMTSQQMYYLHEMTKLTQSIGHEEELPPPQFPNVPPDSYQAIDTGQSDKRIALETKVWKRIQYVSQRFFQQDATDASVYAKHEGFLFFVVIWDHWQPSLKDVICHLSRSTVRLGPEDERQYLWDDDFDKET